MREFRPHAAVEATTLLGLLEAFAGFPPEHFDEAKVIEVIGNLERLCDAWALPNTRAGAVRLRKAIEQKPRIPASVKAGAEETRNRLSDELQTKFFLSLSSENSALYSNPCARWTAALKAFEPSRFDIEEASKCFALARYTACAFHLMRAFEPVLDRLKTELAITTISNNWERSLEQLENANSAQNGQQVKSGPFINRARYDWFSGCIAHLRNVKHAWRNSTVHEPATIYTEEQARDLYGHVASFMGRLAAGAP